MRSYKVFCVSDLQVPYHDRAFVNAMATAIHDLRQPEDIVLTVGDEMDMQTISRWSEGTPLAYEKSVARDRDLTVEVLRNLGVTDALRSNHTDRLYNTIMRKAPGLLGLPELELENFLRFPELGITLHKEGFVVAPGWLALHGDEAGTSQTAGATAAGLSRKTGMSIVCGHTHRAGIQPVTESFNGKVVRTRYGMEVGCAMDLRFAKYTKGIANWQQAWAVLHVNGKHVHPELVYVEGRSFTVMGERYTW